MGITLTCKNEAMGITLTCGNNTTDKLQIAFNSSNCMRSYSFLWITGILLTSEPSGRN